MAGVKSNRELLTGGKRYAQKAAKKHRVEEVVFDKESRKEYLTGFHKRKLERKKKAQVYNKEQDRLNRIKERKEIRDERKQDMEKQLQKFNETVSKITNINDSEDEDAEWSGFDKEEKEGGDNEEGSESEELKEDELKGILNHKEVYKLTGDEEFEDDLVIDDETTVEVESIENPIVTKMRETNLELIAKVNNVDLSKSEEVLDDSIKKAKNYAVVCGASKESYKDKPKKKKFRYLTKAERKVNVNKERFKAKGRRPPPKKDGKR